MACREATGLTLSQNGTSSAPRPGEPVDYMPLLADWSHGKNLPSFKSVFIGLAIAVHIVVDFFVRSLEKNYTSDLELT